MISRVNTDNISIVADEYGVQRWSNEISLKHAYGDYLLKQGWDVSLDVKISRSSTTIDIVAKCDDQAQLIKVAEALDSSSIQDIVEQTSHYRRHRLDAQVVVVVGQLYSCEGGIEAGARLQKRGIITCLFDSDVYYGTEVVHRNPFEWTYPVMFLLGIFVVTACIVILLN